MCMLLNFRNVDYYIFIILNNNSKLLLFDDYDKFVFVEILVVYKLFILYFLVIFYMIYGLCGEVNKNFFCM